MVFATMGFDLPGDLYQWILGSAVNDEHPPSQRDPDDEHSDRSPAAVAFPTSEYPSNSNPDVAPIETTVDAMAFQIRATILSWSLAWNRGDVIGYCDSYTDAARYVSVNANGGVTVLQGKENITACFVKVFSHCQSVQTKLEQRNKMEHPSGNAMVAGVAGIMEYRNLEIQAIPPRHAVVFGEYQLSFGPGKNSEQTGLFTLHLVEARGIWRIQSEHSSAVVNAP